MPRDDRERRSSQSIRSVLLNRHHKLVAGDEPAIDVRSGVGPGG
jgi:hypothetical protein